MRSGYTGLDPVLRPLSSSAKRTHRKGSKTVRSCLVPDPFKLTNSMGKAHKVRSCLSVKSTNLRISLIYWGFKDLRCYQHVRSFAEIVSVLIIFHFVDQNEWKISFQVSRRSSSLVIVSIWISVEEE